MATHFKWISASALLGAAALLYAVENDRAVFTIGGMGFDPFPLVANKRIHVVVNIKNSGHNSGMIEAAALDRVDKLPDEPTYDPAEISPAVVAANGGELRIISDLGDKPLIFTPSGIKELSNGRAQLKIAGFVTYRDTWLLPQRGIVGFCYVWEPTDTDAGNFGACPEKNYTYSHTFWFGFPIRVRAIPMITAGTQTMTPTTPPIQTPDPKFHINHLETRR